MDFIHVTLSFAFSIISIKRLSYLTIVHHECPIGIREIGGSPSKADESSPLQGPQDPLTRPGRPQSKLIIGNAVGQDIFAMRLCTLPCAGEETNGKNRPRKGPARRLDRMIESGLVHASSRVSSYSKRLCLPMDPALTLTGTFAKLNISIES